MDKQEIEHKLEQAQKDRQGINDNILWLKELRAEAEKPKRRHGDFGLEEVGESSYPRLVTNPASVTGLSISNEYGEIPPGHKITTIFGNIFDLMEGWEEPLEEFDVGGRHFKIYPGDPESFLQIKEIWHKLGQMIMTLKGQQS